MKIPSGASLTMALLVALAVTSRGQQAESQPRKRQVTSQGLVLDSPQDRQGEATLVHPGSAAPAALASPAAAATSPLADVQAHSKFFQYAHVPKRDHYEIGHRKGSEHHFTERHEKAHPKAGEFKTKVRWGDKHGGYGEHYWDYNHAGQDGDSHDEPSDNVHEYEEYEGDNNRNKRDSKRHVPAVQNSPGDSHRYDNDDDHKHTPALTKKHALTESHAHATPNNHRYASDDGHNHSPAESHAYATSNNKRYASDNSHKHTPAVSQAYAASSNHRYASDDSHKHTPAESQAYAASSNHRYASDDGHKHTPADSHTHASTNNQNVFNDDGHKHYPADSHTHATTNNYRYANADSNSHSSASQGLRKDVAKKPAELFLDEATGHIVDKATGQNYKLQPV